MKLTKKITAIVRPEKLEPLKEALFAAKVGGMTISQVNGCGSQHGSPVDEAIRIRTDERGESVI